MSLTVEGTVERKGMGPGAWALVTEKGDSYEIHQGAPNDLLKAGQKVKVKGKVREDVMTLAMIGPVLEVSSFEVMN
ncbi:hypothetical protein [Microcoleus sp. FACHB-68]|jgi:hypothetical protein|uniref:hypothetical protein n=1 Tax=Microcoleus sp. FACHB-68 TaxID=2692826 RepID=UPI001684EFEF|nr:hypothetical protein [Microcoleus sp. FACHB-68]MBD1936849.1 hypothetical protein [Microcoleus sp. FACHB-68]MBW4682584.1 hypothetical protein [Microcoleus vaginatus WJT46-NPBG5]